MAMAATTTKTLLLTLSLLLLSTTLSFSLVTQRREEDLRRELQQCRERCRESGQGRGQQQRQCEERCQERYEQERERRQQRNQGQYGEEEEGEEWGPTGGGRESRNPYVFREESIRHQYRSEQGSVRILENFLRKSRLHLGIANYRIAFFEMNPRTFSMPTHTDADEVFYVMKGEGTVTLIRQDKDRESHDIREGDVMKVSAGTVMYVINRSNNQRLQIVKILSPASTPGRFEMFFTVGGDQPESYFRAFSNDLLQAALNANREDLQRVFGQQRQGMIVRASEQQIRALQSRSSSSSEHKTHWPFGGGGGDSQRGSINLFDQRPTFSNRHGQLHEVDPDDFHPLRDLDVRVSYANITRGSMLAPHFNSRSTKIVIVRSGRARVEMVCPHLSEEQRRGGGGGYGGEEEWEEEEGEHGEGEGRRFQLVRSDLTRNTVFIVPPGHPVSVVATGDENFEAVCFEINARNNQRNFLAGRDNVVSKMEKEAQELAFGVPAQLVERVFGGGRQQEQAFLPGPQQQQQREEEEGSRRPLQSILEV